MDARVEQIDGTFKTEDREPVCVAEISVMHVAIALRVQISMIACLLGMAIYLQSMSGWSICPSAKCGSASTVMAIGSY
jgi:hypothetical protein